MKIYQDKIEDLLLQEKKQKFLYNILSVLRFVVIITGIFSLYFYLDTQQKILLYTVFFAVFLFLILVRIHQNIAIKRQFIQALTQINQTELDYLSNGKLNFSNGSNYINTQHPYTHDLDIFGEKSLFHNINRTYTIIGEKKLADQLSAILHKDEIVQNQSAVKELSHRIDWRQRFSAYAKLTQDSEKLFNIVRDWNDKPHDKVSIIIKVIAYFSPVLFLGLAIAYFYTSDLLYAKYLSYIFIFNQIIFGMNFKKITKEINNSDEIDGMIRHYSNILECIENENFEDKKLVNLQNQLKFSGSRSSINLKKLSELFSRMDTVGNLVVAILFNGVFLFHIHVLDSLFNWKKKHQKDLNDWFKVIGAFEMLNTLANLSYNNQEFVFPEINENYRIDFENLGHPLLKSSIRVNNDVSFNEQQFMILTGSNMSGKSTFLRSMGINMVLAGIGSAVCASKANVHPLNIFVSMRLSDSLSDSESYFFAEIKRLKQIMDAINQDRIFVLLDEILRGTNSEDKQNGTIGVIQKMVAKKVIGAIATHDIEVCALKNIYPNDISNYCFEVSIIDDMLHFDYKLIEGICRNKSATFLMKKMEII